MHLRHFILSALAFAPGVSEYMIYMVKHIPCGIHVEFLDST